MRRAHNFIDMTGKVFGRLTVLELVSAGKRPRWRCHCACGVERIVVGGSLRRGLTKSCGCLLQENRHRTDNKFRTHGATSTPTYRTWLAMIDRCSRRGNKDWHKYGGRGIEVCYRWRDSFAAFLEDMGERPAGTTLDRWPNNDGDYEPGNCRWATAREQGRNTRSTRRITVNGESLPLIEWAERVGIGASTIRERLRRGWTPEEAVGVTPLRKGLEFLHPAPPRRRELPVVAGKELQVA